MQSVQKIYNKGSGKLNEDELLIKDNTFAVFDGAGSLVKFVKDGKTGGKIAAEIAKEAFSKNNVALEKAAEIANNKISERMKACGVDTAKKENRWSASMAAIRIKNGKVEFFSIGDCLILAIFKDLSYKLATAYVDHDIGTMVKWRKLADKKVEDIWTKLKPQTIKVRRATNVTYGCMNGEIAAKRFFNSGEIKLENVRSLILFTDGLLIPKENPKAAEDWGVFAKMYLKGGLKVLLKYVRTLENSDSNCWKYPRFKQHDDAAAIGIDFL